LLVEYARAKGAKSIVRGLRAVADFEYEFQIAMVNRKLNPEVDSVYLMTRWEYSYLSSSVVREVAMHGGDISGLVPEAVRPVLLAAVKRALSEQKKP
jgi:pantetheine-phosphate adenylyltransferase